MPSRMRTKRGGRLQRRWQSLRLVSLAGVWCMWALLMQAYMPCTWALLMQAYMPCTCTAVLTMQLLAHGHLSPALRQLASTPICRGCCRRGGGCAAGLHLHPGVCR